MRSKKFVVVYAIVLFLIVFLIAFNSVCAIAQVEVKFDVSSAEAKERAEDIQNELDGFLKKNFLFFDTERIEEIFQRSENCHFKVLSVKKRFPNKISVEVCERYERYAFYDAVSEKYYVTEGSLEVITSKATAANNVGGSNVAVFGFALRRTDAGEKISSSSEQADCFHKVVSALAYFEKELPFARANILSAEYISEKDWAVFQTQEGVKFRFTNISKYNEALAESVLNIYVNLSDGEKTYGTIEATVTNDGAPNAGWTAIEYN